MDMRGRAMERDLLLTRAALCFTFLNERMHSKVLRHVLFSFWLVYLRLISFRPFYLLRAAVSLYFPLLGFYFLFCRIHDLRKPLSKSLNLWFCSRKTLLWQKRFC